jgi:hypothetical protein
MKIIMIMVIMVMVVVMMVPSSPFMLFFAFVLFGVASFADFASPFLFLLDLLSFSLPLLLFDFFASSCDGVGDVGASHT